MIHAAFRVAYQDREALKAFELWAWAVGKAPDLFRREVLPLDVGEEKVPLVDGSGGVLWPGGWIPSPCPEWSTIAKFENRSKKPTFTGLLTKKIGRIELSFLNSHPIPLMLRQ